MVKTVQGFYPGSGNKSGESEIDSKKVNFKRSGKREEGKSQLDKSGSSTGGTMKADRSMGNLIYRPLNPGLMRK
jgi:hypothetical protein